MNDLSMAVVKRQLSKEEIEGIESVALDLPQTECPLQHFFAPGVYCRQIFMPAGTFVLGHEHKTEHLNIVISGRVLVNMNGVVHEIIGPHTFKSEAGVRKALYIVEGTIWQTIHPTDTTDLDELRKELIVESDAFVEHQKQLADVEKLKHAIKQRSQKPHSHD